MPAGLTVVNNSNTVQIDESWRNFGYKTRFSASITVPWTGNGRTAYGFTVSGTAGMYCACKASQIMPMRAHSYYDGSSWTFNWWMWHPLTSAVDITETVEFWFFDTLPLSGYSTVGLEVFNAAGERVYHSDAPMMKVGGVQQCSSSFSGTGGHSYVPLVLQNPICGAPIAFPGGFRVGAYCLRVSGSDIISDLRISNSDGASGSYTNPGLYAAIDVTGL